MLMVLLLTFVAIVCQAIVAAVVVVVVVVMVVALVGITIDVVVVVFWHGLISKLRTTWCTLDKSFLFTVFGHACCNFFVFACKVSL